MQHRGNSSISHSFRADGWNFSVKVGLFLLLLSSFQWQLLQEGEALMADEKKMEEVNGGCCFVLPPVHSPSG